MSENLLVNYMQVLNELPKGHVMQIVATCRDCGSPIYGQETINSNETPEVKRTCACYPKYTTPYVAPYPYTMPQPYYVPSTAPMPNVYPNTNPFVYQTYQVGAGTICSNYVLDYTPDYTNWDGSTIGESKAC